MPEEFITAKAVGEMLETTTKIVRELVERGLLHPVQLSPHKKMYPRNEVEELVSKKGQIDLLQKKESVVSPRNTLNDLNGTEWLPETKSFFFQRGLGSSSSAAQIERQHPAPFSFQDIEKLITFFTKKEMVVLDPFGGVGSTAKACELTGRKCISIELSKKWHDLSLLRLETEVGKGTSSKHEFINGDCISVLAKMNDNVIDFMVTSPPYWSILNKKLDHKTQKRADQNLETHYSDDKLDLGNIEDYNEFLDVLVDKVFIPCARVLKPTKYMALVVSDFRNKSEYMSFHSDLIIRMRNRELPGNCILRLQGTKILLQNHKSLLPYGYPCSYVENIHHQYVLIFRKEALPVKKGKAK